MKNGLCAIILIFPLLSGVAHAGKDDPPAAYEQWCAPCHGVGPGKAGTNVLSRRYNGLRPAVLAERTDLPAPAVKAIVRHGFHIMPPFRKTEISDSELDAIANYVARKR